MKKAILFSILGIFVLSSVLVSAGLFDFWKEDKKWKPQDFYFTSEDIQADNFWINKYNSPQHNQIVSRVSMQLNNSNDYLNGKTETITIFYPSDEQLLDFKIVPSNPSEDEKMLNNESYVAEKSNSISPSEKKDKTKEQKKVDIETKINSLSISSANKNKLKVGKLGDYASKTFEVQFKDDEEYLIQAFVSSEYGKEEKLYLYVEGSFAGGSGTAGDPYQIETWEQLDSIRDVDEYTYYSFVLNNDLNASTTGYSTYASPSANGSQGWEPIGSGSFRLRMYFDGQNHTIRDFFINRSTNYVGIFGYSDGGFIQNLKTENSTVIGTDYVGTLIGQHSAEEFNIVCIDGIVEGDDYVGGVSGKYYGSSKDFQNVYSSINVSGDMYVGGLVGDRHHADIDKSYSVGVVTGTSNVGGLIGYNTYGGDVTNSFWDNETSGQSTSIGGTGKTTAQMQSIETYSAWDIVAVSSKADGYANHSYTWNIVNGSSYPFLSWEYTEGEAPSDSCTWNGASNHEFNFSDSCNITTNIDATGYNLTFVGTGTLLFNSTMQICIMGEPPSQQTISMGEEAKVYLGECA